VRNASGERSEGVVFLRGGNPEVSLHHKNGEQLKGRAALKQVWQDSYDEACVLELHARVDMDGLLKEYGDAILEKPTKLVKRSKVPHPVDRPEIERQVAMWKEKGYDVSTIEGVIDKDPNELTVAFLSLQEAIRKSDAAAEALARLDVGGFEERAEAIRAKLREPLKHADLDAEIESLRDAIDSRRHIDARREIEAARERDSKERTKKVLQLVMKQQQALHVEAPSAPDEAVRAIESPPPTRDEATNVIQQYTFDAFLVGESNRFAQAAAAAVAKDLAKAYNPLFITSGPGLGKTHLLHAIGNELRGRSREARVLYTTAQAFVDDVTVAKREGTLAEFRARLREVDCLLVDDVQLFSGQREAQEEFLQVFEDLANGNRVIVLAGDRPPKAIPDLDERLVSRFESGLMATIQPPERETRIAILRRRATAARIDVDADVLPFIADLVEDNVRELGGALNRVVAFSSLMARPITRDLAKEVLRDVTGEAKGGETVGLEQAAGALVPGRSYLIEEDRPANAFQLFARALGGRRGGLVITRTNPKRIRETFSLEADRTLWLTDRESKSEKTIQPVLERIIYEIEDYMSQRPGSVILLDGLEYLVSSNSFEAVLKFVRRVVDTVSESHSLFILSVGPATLKEQERRMIEREMEVLRFE